MCFQLYSWKYDFSVSPRCFCAFAYAADSVQLNQFCTLPGLTSSHFLLGDVPDLTPVTFKIFQMSIFFFLTKRSAWCEHAILFCPFFGCSSFENGRCTVLSEQHCPFIVSHSFSSAYPGSGRGSSNLRREAQTSLTSFLGYCVQLFWRRP